MFRIIKITLLLVALTACGTNPVTGKSELMLISEEQEIMIGQQNYLYLQQAEGGDYVTDPEVQKYVARVGQRLADSSDRPHLPYEFVVLNNSVPNAWSLPGGKIAINRGLLVELNNEAELAAVLAHEIVHSAARHSAQRMQRALLLQSGLQGLSTVVSGNKYEDLVMHGAGLGANVIFFKYSRGDELEADQYGIKYMVVAGYDPEAAVELQKLFVRMAKEAGRQEGGFFASHPASTQRVEANRVTASHYAPEGKLGEKEYAKAMKRLKDDREAYVHLDDGYRALMKRDPRSALEHANQGIAIEPKEAHLYNLKGKAELALGEERKALESFDKAIDLNDHYFDFYLERGLYFYRKGNRSAAKRDLEKSMQLLPTEEAQNALQHL